MQLVAEPMMAGIFVKCPGCNSRLQVPDTFSDELSSNPNSNTQTDRPHRTVWKEQDPTNPNAALSFGIGIGITLIWFVIIYFFQAPADKVSSAFSTGEKLANLFYKHFEISFLNTLFFVWAGAILYLKHLKLKHQRRAMLLDVLPRDLGTEINAQNVGTFIDHVYGLPERLRDSLMVNRIRKALEFFEVRQNVADVSTLMGSQSAIDGSRIMGSYIIVRAFLWAIPLLGFIGTVVGLSGAISGMSFSNVEDVSKIVGSINNVTSGLGTAFDATLLGLIFAVLLNFPLNSLAKHEEETLNDIDAYCNEVLLPRLADGTAGKKELSTPHLPDMSEMANAIVQGLGGSQHEFLSNLNTLSERMLTYADTLEHRNEQYQQAALDHLAQQVAALDARAQEHMDLVRQHQEYVLQHFTQSITQLEHSSNELYQSLVHGQTAVINNFTQKMDNLSTGMETALKTATETTQRSVSSLGEHLIKLETGAKDYQQTVKSAQEESLKLFSEKIASLNNAAHTSLNSTVELTQKTMTSLESGIRSLNTVLEDLSTKQVVIQQVPKKSWFSLG
jgi:hypothetical protein